MDAERIQRLHYDRIAIEYEAHYGDACSQRYRDRFFHQPMFKGVDLSGLQVIEAMCGSGHTTQYLISQGARVIGLDISDETIKSFNKRWPESQGVCEPHKDSFPDLIRRWWYKRDPLFADNEEAIDLSEMKRRFASRFIFNRERYLGNAAYLLVLNSMVFRIPLKLKPFYTPPLLHLESIISPFQGRLLSCFVVCQWRKK